VTIPDSNPDDHDTTSIDESAAATGEIPASDIGAQPVAPDAAALIDAQLESLFSRKSSGPLNWRTMPGADAIDEWQTLREWVDATRREFALDHRTIPPCWYRHPALVSVLSALRDHWSAAHDPMAGLNGPSEWHRAFMLLETRLRDWAARTGCTASQHRRDVIAEYPDGYDEWKTHVDDDVALREERELDDDLNING
jgi:hypothetical protein